VLILALASLLFSILAIASIFVIYVYRLLSDDEFRKNILSREDGFIEPVVITVNLAAGLIELINIGLAKVVTKFKAAFLDATRRYTLKVVVWSTVLLVVVLAFYQLPRMASDRAQQVALGNPIVPPRLPVLPLTLLAIHADPAYVIATGEPGKTPAVDALATRSGLQPPLLYIGQANSTVVMYDSVRDEAVYVPSSSLLLKVVNCRAEPIPPNC
jgi:hypothetical protein